MNQITRIACVLSCVRQVLKILWVQRNKWHEYVKTEQMIRGM